MADSERRAARFSAGSWKRIVHALLLGLLQPVVPVSIFVGLGPLLFAGREALVPPGPLTFVAVAGVGAVGLAVLVGGGLFAIARVSPAELGFRREALGRELLLGVLGLGVYLLCFDVIVRALLPDADHVFHNLLTQSPGERALLLVVGLAIALFEEPVFRGYLQPALVERLGLAGGVAVTALVFAAWHPPHFTLPSFLVRLSLGLVTGALRARDRPLTAAVTAHTLLWAVVGLS